MKEKIPEELKQELLEHLEKHPRFFATSSKFSNRTSSSLLVLVADKQKEYTWMNWLTISLLQKNKDLSYWVSKKKLCFLESFLLEELIPKFEIKKHPVIKEIQSRKEEI